MLGSCFTDHIARCLGEYYFAVTSNPYGTLYNPVSIAHHIDEAVAAYQPTVVFITLGTSWVYVDKATDQVVDNCRKRPASDFLRRRLTVSEIVELWRPIVERYSDIRFVFTVSPIRHQKDGFHENQISKAILLEAVDILTSNSSKDGLTSGSASGHVTYFPSYEIMLDELRDYRYYADDLVHPSSLAVQYIWERFSEAYIYEPSTLASMRELHAYYLLSHHRPLHPGTAEAEEHAVRVEQERRSLQSRYPNLTL